MIYFLLDWLIGSFGGGSSGTKLQATSVERIKIAIFTSIPAFSGLNNNIPEKYDICAGKMTIGSVVRRAFVQTHSS